MKGLQELAAVLEHLPGQHRQQTHAGSDGSDGKWGSYITSLGLLSGGKATKDLGVQINYGKDLGVMTRRGFVEYAHSKGWKAEQSEIYNPKSKQKTKHWFIGNWESTPTQIGYLNYLAK